MAAAGDQRAAEALNKRVVAVLNSGSGSCNEESEARANAIFAQAGLPHAVVTRVEPAKIDAALDEAIAHADVLVVLGGDGTIRTAADKCRASKIFLLPLPGGTMNMLPKALYGQRAWPEALADTLADSEVHEVSGGKAGDHGFFVAAMLGAPTLWADAREAVRGGRLVEAVKRSITAARRGMSEPLDYQFGEALRGSAEAVVVVCPLISKVMSEDERCLEAAALDPDAAGLFRLGFHALFDDWRADESVSRAKVRQVVVTGHGRVPVILDGEKTRMGRRVEISFTPVAFRALVPGAAAREAGEGVKSVLEMARDPTRERGQGAR
ncbi:MAG: NAD(+)/NADH kinase [Caulobacteraceae bacterium]|nr:NAD(+)/NADH kinase [Caulobacteraceae bacterium]